MSGNWSSCPVVSEELWFELGGVSKGGSRIEGPGSLQVSANGDPYLSTGDPPAS